MANLVRHPPPPHFRLPCLSLFSPSPSLSPTSYPSPYPAHSHPRLTQGVQQTGKAVNCNYCPNCTSHVFHHQEVMGDKIVVRTVLLDGGKNFKPSAEIFGKSKMSWEPEVAKTFETLPPS